MAVKSVKELQVYKSTHALGLRTFELSKGFRPEERYALAG